MDAFEIIAETIVGTTLMTSFSYLMSESFRKLFVEPVLINYVIRISGARVNPKLNSALGWLLHYIVGLAFVMAYHLIWHFGWMDDGWLSGLILGAVSGVIGIVSWMIIFSLPSEDPKVAFGQYYLQLFFAHVVFALAAVGVHRLY